MTRWATQYTNPMRANCGGTWCVGTWLLAIVMLIPGLLSLSSAVAATGEGSLEKQKPTILRLSLDDALAMFLRQNLDLLKTKYGIDAAKAQQITAGLFPNPELSINTLTAYTQDCNLSKCGGIMPVISQLFLVAGKRGFRVESAEFGTQSAEAGFEDTLRQLGFAVKDAYYRVQVGHRLLADDEQRSSRINGAIEKLVGAPTKMQDPEDLIRLQIRAVKTQGDIIRDIQQLDSDRSDLLLLLTLPPETELALTTDLTFQPIDPDMVALKKRVEDARPDLRAKRLLLAKRRSESKLAIANQYPDVTVDLGYNVQGPQGPDNQQQWTINLGMPIPVFDRNQGGIKEAATKVHMAEADLQKTLNEVHHQINTVYRHLGQSRLLVETYRAGAFEATQALLDRVENDFHSGETTILHLLDAFQTKINIDKAYINALYEYQRDILLLESAVAQPIS
ncbi:TolC family protein [Candidatus Nitrospira allomarina]|uniref:TolC family protein n=1 Tax=Candidatus Nitrospira allomarina TaxID=3020900 RepID=A0AA96GAN9_9BACT|nr:TolC family protein [Candidatus Nitrospira allomarina]WNM57547.1 TolC family protein [Candidatus Nitrospira allomarina]